MKKLVLILTTLLCPFFIWKSFGQDTLHLKNKYCKEGSVFLADTITGYMLPLFYKSLKDSLPINGIVVSKGRKQSSIITVVNGYPLVKQTDYNNLKVKCFQDLNTRNYVTFWKWKKGKKRIDCYYTEEGVLKNIRALCTREYFFKVKELYYLEGKKIKSKTKIPQHDFMEKVKRILPAFETH